jgi:hypothetical protein
VQGKSEHSEQNATPRSPAQVLILHTRQ